MLSIDMHQLLRHWKVGTDSHLYIAGKNIRALFQGVNVIFRENFLYTHHIHSYSNIMKKVNLDLSGSAEKKTLFFTWKIKITILLIIMGHRWAQAFTWSTPR
jgi:hypothetical protein